MESVCESSVQAMISHCEKTLAEIRVDLESVKTQIDRVWRLKLRVAQVTSPVGQTRTQIVDQILSIVDWYSERRIRWTKRTEISSRDARQSKRDCRSWKILKGSRIARRKRNWRKCCREILQSLTENCRKLRSSLEKSSKISWI
jgi:hypothetical protein